jgi:hypothetical protein
MSIELRHRTSSRELSSYSRVKSSSDEDDNTDIINSSYNISTSSSSSSSSSYNNLQGQKTIINRIPIPKSTFCVKTCFFFSLAGIIFLSVIAYLLGTNSVYLEVSSENSHRKPELVSGTLGAVLIYLICLVISGYIWYKTVTSREEFYGINKRGSDDTMD